METEIIGNKDYPWVEMSFDDLQEFINIGSIFGFCYNDKAYYIEGRCFDNDAKGRVGCYYIWGETHSFPENEQAKTADELRALPFIEGKTIVERFGELRFFDPYEVECEEDEEE